MTSFKVAAHRRRQLAMWALMVGLQIWVMSLHLSPRLAHAETKDFHEGEESAVVHEQTELDHRCAATVIQALPLAVIGAPHLAVDRITLHVEPSFFTIFISLKKPQGSMTHVFMGVRTFDGAAKLMQVLQSHALKSVKAVAYLPKFGPDVVRVGEEAQKTCSADQLQSFLELCTECRIKELAFSGHVD